MNQITNELEYYPLNTGNYFEYLSISQQMPYPADSSGYSIKVLNDTTLENGKRYKILQYKDILKYYSTYYKYERVDSTTGAVYRFNKNLSSQNKEYKIDSLFAQPSDTINCSREGISSFGYFKTICVAQKVVTLFGLPFEIKEFFDQSFIPGLHYTLAKGLGFYSSSSWEMSSSHTGLVYAEINGNIFGKTITSIDKTAQSLPLNFILYQNYPNPFNPATTIKFSLPENAFTKLIVFDILGREVKILVNQNLEAGYHEVEFNAINLPSGIYFYRMQANDFITSRKMLLIK
ncbi:MAG: T9SS type A sorting domain-containing protein [Melioribacteraceae bacterium]|nr:T9SS type A sorting domain-containing protein [Melioribacteraceae bacterium]